MLKPQIVFPLFYSFTTAWNFFWGFRSESRRLILMSYHWKERIRVLVRNLKVFYHKFRREDTKGNKIGFERGQILTRNKCLIFPELELSITVPPTSLVDVLTVIMATILFVGVIRVSSDPKLQTLSN